MIGVLSREHQKAAVEEFFELFKTPWERCQEDKTYDVVITTIPDASTPPTKLVIVFGSEATSFDSSNGVKIISRDKKIDIDWEGAKIPIYGELATFKEPSKPFLSNDRGNTAGLVIQCPDSRILRIGYDLFDEIDHLLRCGQPAGKARVPTLELHIAMLRQWILGSGIPLIEIPPSPYGYDFTTCLTHDIDFMGIRDHKLDHTMLGFSYRSLIPKYLKGLDRKTSLARYLKNLKALLSLPLVYMGILPDFWFPLEGYREMEKGLKSTFFFIPFKDRPGMPLGGEPAKFRAARYDIGRFKEQIRSLTRQGCEVGLHGIDAWHDAAKGREELEVIRGITEKQKIGIRMHWLYSSDETPKKLEEAGVYYDSTLGYNEDIGFRSGTAQVFRLPGTSSVFELPLHVQDTAMLLTGRMGVSEPQAIALCGRLIEEVRTYGGVITINWHDRSLAPERNWDGIYRVLLGMLRAEKTWFATAGEAVAWFEKRRAIRFELAESADGVPKIRMPETEPGKGPPLTLRVYRPKGLPHEETEILKIFKDYPLNADKEFGGGY